MNSWMGLCLYVAAGVFIQDQRSDDRHAQSIPNLERILAALKAIGNRHPITKHFTAQLELDIESSGIRNHSTFTGKGGIPSTPMNGIDTTRRGVPMTFHDLPTYRPNSKNLMRVEPISLCIQSMAAKCIGVGNPVPKAGLTPMFSILPRESQNVQAPNQLHVGTPINAGLAHWNPPANTVLDKTPKLKQNSHRRQQQRQQQQQVALESRGFESSNPPPVSADPNVGGSCFNIDSFLAGHTPSSNSSGSNTCKIPYHEAYPNLNISGDYTMFQADSSIFITTPDWTFNTEPLSGS